MKYSILLTIIITLISLSCKTKFIKQEISINKSQKHYSVKDYFVCKCIDFAFEEKVEGEINKLDV